MNFTVTKRQQSGRKEIVMEAIDKNESKVDILVLIIQVLEEPYTYLLQIPGKGIRGHLTKAFNMWMQIDEKKLTEITEIVEMLHTSSLL